jgi:Protein of unknown function (DUF2845)
MKLRRQLHSGIAILVLALCLPQAAWAFRCGTRLVSEGDTAGEVRAKCGEPTDIQRRYLWRAPIFWHGGRPIRVYGGDIEVPVETWIYNLGPHRLMRQVRLEDGVVVEIETLGYGYP